MEYENDILMHYGRSKLDGAPGVGSGRYPLGSGDNPNQRMKSFLTQHSELAKSGISSTDLARYFGFTRIDKDGNIQGDTRGLRAYVQYCNAYTKDNDRREAERMRYEEQMSLEAIAEKLGRSSSSVSMLLRASEEQKRNLVLETVDELKKQVAEKKYLEVGANQNLFLSENIGAKVSEERMKNTLEVLEAEGYKVYPVMVKQLGTGKYTTMKVLCEPGTTYEELNQHRADIKGIFEFNVDEYGKTRLGIAPPVSVDSSRVMINYAETGGTDKDGVIELRRGVDDISLGTAAYAQVRIAVDGTHYLKGMAMYADDLPDGVDIRFNTNKHEGTPMLGSKDDTVLKPLKADQDNPFGTTLKPDDKLTTMQKYYTDPVTGEVKQSAINVVKEQGDVGEWKKTLAAQFLSKQPLELVNRQIGIAVGQRQAEFEEINSLTNPTVKRKMLESFADSCDYDAVHLHAAALPRQSSNFLLPFSGLKENEVYAPNYRDGETVVLIRYPHAGTFEIPVLKVTNKKDTDAKRTITNAPDAIGVNPKVLPQLSGADCDGDTVMVIPIKSSKGDTIVNVKADKAIAELQKFDPTIYAMPKGMSNNMSDATKGREMGVVSNLITDMTLKGAPVDHVVRAVKHSMVVIDAQKHNYDWKRSEKENGIAELKKLYQYDEETGKYGAGTLISRARSPYYVNERSDRVSINPETGEKIYTETGKMRNKSKTQTVTDPETGEKKKVKVWLDETTPSQTKSTRMAEARDARELLSSSPNQKEVAYANYANSLKALANAARKEAIATQDNTYSPSAAKQYKAEVESLNEKVLIAQKNSPKEKQAQILANAEVRTKILNNPNLKEDKDALKKINTQALSAAREIVGANKKASQIKISDREWQAIQAGAISKTKLNTIIKNTDEKSLRQLAMPKETKSLTNAQIARAKALINSGMTQAQVADQFGVSASTIYRLTQ